MTKKEPLDSDSVEPILANYPRRGGQSFLIPVLQDIQQRFGYLPEAAMKQVNGYLDVALPKIYGVATFYAQFHFEPHGRHVIRCCRGTACHVRGAKQILATVKTALQVDEGETTRDMEFTLETVACLGTCFLAPVAMVDHGYFGRLTPRKVSEVLAGYRRG